MNLISIDGKLYHGHSIIIRGNWIVIDGESIKKEFKEINIKGSDEKSSIFDSPRINSLSDQKNKQNGSEEI